MSCPRRARVVVTDTQTKQVKNQHIRFPVALNPQLTVKRHKDARAALYKARSIACVGIDIVCKNFVFRLTLRLCDRNAKTVPMYNEHFFKKKKVGM